MGKKSPGWPTWAGGPTPIREVPWTGCSPLALRMAAAPGPSSFKPTTGRTGPERTSPPLISWTGCAGSITPSRPCTAGPWWRDGAKGPLCPPSTLGTHATQGPNDLGNLTTQGPNDPGTKRPGDLSGRRVWAVRLIIPGCTAPSPA